MSAQSTRHVRCHISDQVASPMSLLDFYSFSRDFAHYLIICFRHGNRRIRGMHSVLAVSDGEE